MATLALEVTSSATDWTVSADIGDDIQYLLAEDELVRVAATFPSSIYAPTGETTPARVRVERAIGGTTAASHAQGISLTEYRDEEAFGGAGGGGEQTVYVQATDPGAVGAGKLWVDTTSVDPVTIRVRNTDDNAWVDVFAAYRSALSVYVAAAADGTNLGGEIQVDQAQDPTGGSAFLAGGQGDGEGGKATLKGGASASRTAGAVEAWGASDLEDEEAGGKVDIRGGEGTGGAVGAAIVLTGGNNMAGDVGGEAFFSGRAAEFTFEEPVAIVAPALDVEGNITGFTLLAPDSPPEVPAAPTEQDIVDALLALGLVTQAAP